MITALRSAVPGVGASMLQLPGSAQPPIQTVLIAVLNELAGTPVDVDLVLDHYHLVDGPDVRGGMVFLLEYALTHHIRSLGSPPQSPHVVMPAHHICF